METQKLIDQILRDVQANPDFQSYIARYCNWCETYQGLIDGLGSVGVTSYTCPDCREQAEAYYRAGGK